jgi:hypothetical protein
MLKMTGRTAASPLKTLDWGIEVLTEAFDLAGCYVDGRMT